MSSSRPLRGAIIGCGFIAENGHLPAYRQHPSAFHIAALSDTNPERRARAMELVPGARVHETPEAMLSSDEATAGLDFVDICTPPSEHARLTHMALERGLHVLCEKPLATTPESARAMLEHARRARRVIFPCHNYKHAPVVQAVNRVLCSGVIGAVHAVTLQTFRTTHARGVPAWRPDWRRERRWSGGGIAMDHGSHTFYLTFDWLGGYPSSITAKMTSQPGFDTEDNVACSVTFPRGIAHAYLTWTSGIRKVLYTLHGNSGAIRIEDDDMEVSVMKRHARALPGRLTWETSRESVSSAWMDAGHADWFTSLLAQFSAAIARDEHVGKEARDSLACVELIAAAYASAADGSRERRVDAEPG